MDTVLNPNNTIQDFIDELVTLGMRNDTAELFAKSSVNVNRLNYIHYDGMKVLKAFRDPLSFAILDKFRDVTSYEFVRKDIERTKNQIQIANLTADYVNATLVEQKVY